MGRMSDLLIEFEESCTSSSEGGSDGEYDAGQRLKLTYKGKDREVEFVKPILLAKAGIGIMVIDEGITKTFALDLHHCAQMPSFAGL